MSPRTRPGADAVAAKGWLAAHKWLLLRRASQALVPGLFLVGPLTGLWIVKGDLAASLTLDILPLADPHIVAQSLAAGHAVGRDAVIGAVILVVFYLVVGGRAYCAWVCPVNVVTDGARWLRRRLGIGGGIRMSRRIRYWVLSMTLVLPAATGTIAWELVNPVTIVFRALVFGVGAAWAVAATVFLLDLFVGNRLWCGHLCPVGAFYSLLGAGSLLRVAARRRSACNNCNECYAVCPEPHVITPALKGAAGGAGGPVILASNCTNCGRCVDICAPDVFAFATRFGGKPKGVENDAGVDAMRPAA